MEEELKIYKFYSDKNIKEFWEQYWDRIKEDSDYIIDYNYYPFIPLKQYLKKGDRILEIGCGTGRVLKGLFNEGYNILGFDFDYNSLRSVNLRKKYPVFLADIINIPVRNDLFDVILCFGVLTCIEKESVREDIFKNIRAILKPDGIFIVSLINYNLLRKIQRCLLFKKFRKQKKHFYGWAANISDLTSILEKHFVILTKFPGRMREPIWRYAPFLRRVKNVDEKIARVDDKQYVLNFFGEGLFRLFNFLCPYTISGGTIFVCKNLK